MRNGAEENISQRRRVVNVSLCELADISSVDKHPAIKSNYFPVRMKIHEVTVNQDECQQDVGPRAEINSEKMRSSRDCSSSWS